MGYIPLVSIVTFIPFLFNFLIIFNIKGNSPEGNYNDRKVLEITKNGEVLISELYGRGRSSIYLLFFGAEDIGLGKTKKYEKFIKKIEKLEKSTTANTIEKILAENLCLTEVGERYIENGFGGKKGEIKMVLNTLTGEINDLKEELEYYNTIKGKLDYFVRHFTEVLKRKTCLNDQKEVLEVKITSLERMLKRSEKRFEETPKEPINYIIEKIVGPDIEEYFSGVGERFKTREFGIWERDHKTKPF